MVKAIYTRTLAEQEFRAPAPDLTGNFTASVFPDPDAMLKGESEFP